MYEVRIDLEDGKSSAVMLKTCDESEAIAYMKQLQQTGKYRRNIVRVVATQI